MSVWDRFLLSACVGMLAYMAAYDLGLPAWRNEPPGDAADFGVISFVLVNKLQKRSRMNP